MDGGFICGVLTQTNILTCRMLNDIMSALKKQRSSKLIFTLTIFTILDVTSEICHINGTEIYIHHFWYEVHICSFLVITYFTFCWLKGLTWAHRSTRPPGVGSGGWEHAPTQTPGVQSLRGCHIFSGGVAASQPASQPTSQPAPRPTPPPPVPPGYRSNLGWADNAYRTLSLLIHNASICCRQRDRLFTLNPSLTGSQPTPSANPYSLRAAGTTRGYPHPPTTHRYFGRYWRFFMPDTIFSLSLCLMLWEFFRLLVN